MIIFDKYKIGLRIIEQVALKILCFQGNIEIRKRSLFFFTFRKIHFSLFVYNNTKMTLTGKIQSEIDKLERREANSYVRSVNLQPPNKNFTSACIMEVRRCKHASHSCEPNGDARRGLNSATTAMIFIGLIAIICGFSLRTIAEQPSPRISRIRSRPINSRFVPRMEQKRGDNIRVVD